MAAITTAILSIALPIVLAAWGIGQGYGSEARSLDRNKVATEIAAVWDEVIKKYNVTSNQLSQALEQLGLKREQLMDAFKYSARLAKARKMAAQFMRQYPEKAAQIRNETQILEKRISDASKKRDQQYGEAQSGSRNDAVGSMWEATQHYSQTQRELNQGDKTPGAQGNTAPTGAVVYNDALNKHYENEN